jgi:L-amino acid N-acyltransferase YncA
VLSAAGEGSRYVSRLRMRIREAAKADFEQIWAIFTEIVRAGETYAYARNTTKGEARKIKLWNQLGFATVGRVPKAFDHPTNGYVDALVMYNWLEK